MDRLWPRGLSEDEVKADVWLKDIAPSNELRKWFGHQPEKWGEFKKRYFEELQEKKELVEGLSLLQGWRGSPLKDVDALKEVLLRFSAMVEDFPEIERWR